MPSLSDPEWQRFSRFPSLRELAIVAKYWASDHRQGQEVLGHEMLGANLAVALPSTNVCVLESDEMTTVDSNTVCPAATALRLAACTQGCTPAPPY